MSTTTSTDAVATITTELKQWCFGPGSGRLILPKRTFEATPERDVSLKGLKLRKFLRYHHENFGINLDWTGDAEPKTEVEVRRWFLEHAGDQNQPITYGEPVALANGKGESYLHYQQRTVGINLNWTGQPVYEWRILGGIVGQPIRTGEHVAIYNSAVDGTGGPNGDFFIYFDRHLGADIGWTTSPSWTDYIKEYVPELLTDGAWRAVALAAFGL